MLRDQCALDSLTGSSVNLANTLHELGVVKMKAMETAEAQTFLEHALSLKRRLCERKLCQPREQADTLHQLGVLVRTPKLFVP